ncbi:uncharacterized protein LOC105837316 [Monomorium pharaonis]|uniref:uncharacterized protein LOC105837316 n=1 Tax=Monomorium pharaonis TaxID=307658 RepID=UPI00063F74F6|nr:uncharacterized protein LOC105837316 [Monomorium pharaonis]
MFLRSHEMQFSNSMYLSSVNSFAASWLLLCLVIPFYSGAERLDWVPYEVNPMHHQFRSVSSESVSSVEQSQQPNILKSLQYNVQHSKYNLVPSRMPSKNYHSFDGNQKISKEDSAARLQHEEIDEEVIKKMNLLDKVLSEDIDVNDTEIKNTVEDEIIAEMKISEETKRVARQVRKKRPGFFWTLARLAFETFNDTRSAIKQISNLINQNIEPDPTTRRPTGSHPLMVTEATTVAPSVDQNNTSSNMTNVNATMTTTTQAPFRLTPTNLQNLILRNVRGLVRLFNIEWQDALNQSDITVKEFRKDLGKQVGTFLQDNPNAF